MKILQIITLSTLGGAQTVLYELSNALNKKGHYITVISSPGGDLWKVLNKKIKKIECKYFKREISPLNDLKAIFFIKKIIKSNNYDIIHLHSSKAGVWGRLAAGKKYKNKVIYTVHGFDTILKANKIFLFLEKLLKNHCKYLVPVSEYDNKNLKSCNIKNCYTIKNGIKDLVLNDSNVQNIFTLHKKNEKIIVSIARLQPPKKFDMFLQVAERLGKEGFAFYWIGNQYEIKDLPYNTFCLGEMKDARRYLQYADLFVLFSNYEGLPVSIIEAFASSVPVVASAVGGVSELLNGENGIAIENTVDNAVQAILTIMRGNIESFKKAARDTYEKNFKIDKMVNEYLNLYRECK